MHTAKLKIEVVSCEERQSDPKDSFIMSIDTLKGLLHTCYASHSSIFRVHTVVGTKWVGRTVDESSLSSMTLDIVQPDLTSSIREPLN